MAFIESTSPGQANGRIGAIYSAAVKRAGRVYNIVRLQSSNPSVLTASLNLYQAVMFGKSPLSRVEREAIAVTVSRSNDCFY
jgi:alkylhydroperoxidase family enzyme